MNSKQNVVLRGKDVYAQIVKIDENPLLDKNNVPYKRYSFQAIAFTLREPAYKCFDSGDMSSLTLVPTQREDNLLDTVTNTPTGQTMIRDGWSYGGHLTHEQDLKLEAHQARLKAIYTGAGDRIMNDPNIPLAGTVLSGEIPAQAYPFSRKNSGGSQVRPVDAPPGAAQAVNSMGIPPGGKPSDVVNSSQPTPNQNAQNPNP